MISSSPPPQGPSLQFQSLDRPPSPRKRECVSITELGARIRKKGQLRFLSDLQPAEWFLDRASFYELDSDCWTTMNTAHELVKLGDSTFFIAALPEGDFVVHQHKPMNTDPKQPCGYPITAEQAAPGGYSGADVTFLLRDGSLATVQGPVRCHAWFPDFKNAAQQLAMPGLCKKARKIRVGKQNQDFELEQVVHEEKERSIHPILPKLRRFQDKWAGLDVEVNSRNEEVYVLPISQLLQMPEDEI